MYFLSFYLQFLDIGIITSIEYNHKQVETARKGQEVCIKIESIPGESPKMYGRHFEETDMLISKVSCMECNWKIDSSLKCLYIIAHRKQSTHAQEYNIFCLNSSTDSA